MYKRDEIFFKTLEKSVEQYLDELSDYDDLQVSSGVNATKEYIQQLKMHIKQLEESNYLKDEYLKRLKEKLDEHH